MNPILHINYGPRGRGEAQHIPPWDRSIGGIDRDSDADIRIRDPEYAKVQLKLVLAALSQARR